MRIVFMGTPESAVPSLRRLIEDGHEVAGVWTQPDRPAGRGNKLHPSPVKTFAIEQGLSVHQPTKIKTPEALELFQSPRADVVVVVAYGRILPGTFLSTPPRGCINVHFSLLPEYRGAAPVNWAIVNGESETGVTTMKIVEELDAGPILLQRSTAIEAIETAPQLMTRLAEIGADLVSETLAGLEQIHAKPQEDDEATFAPMLKREDGLIDWSMDAFAIERRVRGLQPWPNAHTTLGSRRLIIWRAAAESTTHAGSGQVLEAHGDNLRVACGENTVLRVSELQLQDSRRMSTRDFLNGGHLTPDNRFGASSG
jgi:methionyl-tRNA formyltransferase